MSKSIGQPQCAASLPGIAPFAGGLEQTDQNIDLVGTPVTPADVAKAVRRALKKPRLEIYVPYSESITGRILGAWPWLLSGLYPLLERMGEKGRVKFIRRIGPLPAAPHAGPPVSGG